jgi:hypothetical protein
LTITVANHVLYIMESGSSGRPIMKWLLHPCSLMAADMMHLVAHQLQQPGADRLGALGLAAAGQRLAAACAEVASQQVGPARQQQQQVPQQNEQQACSAPCNEQDAPYDPVGDLVDSTLFLAAFSMGNLCTGLLELNQALGTGPGTAGMAGLVAAQSAHEGAVSAKTHAEMDSAMQRLAEQVPRTAALVKGACRLRVQLVGCGNPRCTNLSGPSAEGLVAGRKGVRCGGCRVARYCCPECQQADWPQHRHVCRRLAAAAEPEPETAAPEVAAAAAAATAAPE